MVGAVFMDIICRMREGSILAEKYLMRTLGSLMMAHATWFWNLEMY